MMPSFVLPANTGTSSPDTIERKRRMAQAMLMQGTSGEPIQHWSQGVNKMAQALLGGLAIRNADKQEAEGRKSANDALVRALTGGKGVSQGDDPQGALVEAMNNPFMSPQGSAMAMDMWQKQYMPPDPMAELQRRKMELEVAGMENPPPQPTDDMREYEFAVQHGYKGTPQQFWSDMKRAGAPKQMGTIPPGYRAEYDANGQVTQIVPIEGSPAAAEAAAAQDKQAAREASAQNTAEVITQDIDRAIGILDNDSMLNPAAGFGSGIAGSISGSNSSNIRSLIDTIEANISFDKLQQMRENSPTGGALGGIAVRELDLLGATLGNVKNSQNESQLRDNLNRLWNQYQDVIHGPNGGPPRRKLSFEENGRSDIDALIKKYGG